MTGLLLCNCLVCCQADDWFVGMHLSGLLSSSCVGLYVLVAQLSESKSKVVPVGVLLSEFTGR